MDKVRFLAMKGKDWPWLAVWLGAVPLLAVSLVLTLGTPQESVAANTVIWSKFGQPVTSGTYYPVVLGDLNHDGHLDVVAGADGGGISTWAGDGAGTWSALYAPATSGTYYGLALGDFNDDGHLDIVAVESSTGVQIWIGNGEGKWSTMTPPAAGGKPSCVAVGDINRDGKLDIAVGSHEDAGIELWTGDGAGTWTAAATGLPTTGNYRALAIGDVDRDGRPDLAAASENEGVRAWEGSGGGSWSEESSGLPATGTYNGVALGDLDNDGDLDIAATGGSDQGVQAWTGSSESTWWSWTPASTGLSSTGDFWGVAVGNVDNDGRLDIAAASPGGGVGVWTGDGAGTWTDASTGLPVSGDYLGLALGDLDDDGLPDLVAGSSGYGVATWRDDGKADALGGWLAIVSPTTAGLYQDLDVGDFDHDGDLDVVAASETGGIQLWTGDGGNAWSEISSWTAPDLPASGHYQAVALGEIEPDDWLDVVAASGEGKGVRAWLFRDRSAWFEFFTGLPASGNYLDVTLGDLDDDGILDLVAGSQNLGIGAWTAEDVVGSTPWWDPFSTDLPTSGSYPSVAVGDLDNDGILDLVAGSEGAGLGIWQGDGAGTWKSVPSPVDSGTWPGVALGDVNDDGKLDVVAAYGSGGIAVWAGDGNFGWAEIAGPGSSDIYTRISLGDYNHDGKLDIAAGTASNAGLAVWAGNGGSAWTPYAAGLATVGDYPAVAFGEIDNDGVLDLLGARYGAGSVHAWTGAEGAPPSGWTGFSPGGWISTTQSVDCAIEVQDTGSGLDVDSAKYRFLGASGTWSAWDTADCTGTDGTTTFQTLSVLNVPFDQDSGPGPDHTGNWIQFQVADVVGNVGYSGQELVYIDTTPPENPFWFDSSPHSPGGPCQSDNTIWVDWDPGFDASSGVWGYSHVFSTSYELPGPVFYPSPSQATSDPLPDGNWYIYVRTRDYAGNWAPDAASDGPYCIDTSPPTNPTSFASSPQTGTWVNDNTIAISWSGAADLGSGVHGYSYAWSEYAEGWADDELDTTGTSATSPVLSEGDNWYFHIRTVDEAGNWTTEAAHYGPFLIDKTNPIASISLSSHWVNTRSFAVSWIGWDASSGVASYDVQTSTNAIVWYDWILSTPLRSAYYTGQGGETIYFRVRARDNAGNVGAWSSGYDVTVGVDVTVRVEDEWDNPQSGAAVYLNGVEQGQTGGDGTLVVHYVVLDDELAAKVLIHQEPSVKAHHEWPYGSSWSYRVYLTNVDYDGVGFPLMHTVSSTSVIQELVVRRDNPLIGFHILVSVEWDADRAFLDEVVDAFLAGADPAADYLMDLTDGQMIYEAVEVVDNQRYWADADYQIHASNQVWPNSTGARIYSVTGRGIQVGRQFDSSSSNSGRWDDDVGQRCFVHEFGHYGFDLKDEYKDADGVLDGGCTTDVATSPPDEMACFMDNAYSTNEICSSLGTHPHNTDTWQHTVHSEPCWDTLYHRYRSGTNQWILETPSDRGTDMRGPFMVPVQDWVYSSVTNAATGVCAPFVTTWIYPWARPVFGGDVSVEGARVIQQGQTLADGTIVILGAHDGDTVQVRVTCGSDCSWSDDVSVSCPDLAAQAVSQHVVERDAFSLHLSAAVQASGDLLEIRAQASVALGGPPTVELWQDGATDPVPVTLAYDSASGDYTGSVALSADLGPRGVLRGLASDTQGHEVTVLAPFDVMPVPSAEYAEVSSVDGNLELLLKPHSLAGDAMVSIVANSAVSTTQEGLVLVGKAYEISVSTGQYALDLPAGLSMYYQAEMLTNVISDTLRIYRWDDQAQRWLDMGGLIGPEHSIVSTQVDHLSTFALLGQWAGFRVYLPLTRRDGAP